MNLLILLELNDLRYRRYFDYDFHLAKIFSTLPLMGFLQPRRQLEFTLN